MKVIHFIIPFILFSILLFYSEIYAGNKEYDVANIPERILSGAGIIVRNNTVHFEVLNGQDAVLNVKYAVTIFKKEKQNRGDLQLPYNKYVYIADLEGKLYNNRGEEIRELQSSDVKDYSNFSDYSLYEENRVKLAELYYDRFPYTVEYTYEVRYEGYLDWPYWYSRESTDPVEHNEFTVTVPLNYELRYWCNQDSVQPVVSSSGNTKDYFWQVNQLPKLSSEAEYEDIQDLSVIVRIAPSTFNIDGYEGSMLDWKNFGYWYYTLTQGKENLPQSAIKDIKLISDNCSGVKEKIVKLYSYMQSRTHYVSIQLGIGNWQPYGADYVHNNGYGDCKALSNYMIAILKNAGVSAFPVLINSGEKVYPLITKFPSSQFNHEIVVVPTKEDTVWLECTSQDLPAGSIGWWCENRYALMITSKGGQIVHTPVTLPDQNRQVRSASVKLNTIGTAKIVMNTRWTGDHHVDVLTISRNATYKDQEKWLKKTFKVPDIKLNGFSFTQTENRTDEIILDLSAVLSRYGTVSGNRIFFNPNMVDRRTNFPDDISRKISPIRYNYPYLDIDSVVFNLPDRYKVEAVPNDVNTETSFGRFISRTTINSNNSVTFFRLLEIKDYTIPADDYKAYRNFFSEVVKADRSQVVLTRK